MISQTNSNKPLWIPDVKKSLSDFFSCTINQNNLEQIKDIISDTNNETIDQEEYPYYNTIKKIMYSFGDTNNSNSSTVITMHNFVTKFIEIFCKLINECDFKKIIEHFFSYEHEKLKNYKKLKKNNKFMTGLSDDNNGFLSISEDGNENEDEDGINNYDFSIKQNNLYRENVVFQTERTANMDTKSYSEYSSCRQHNFLSNGKKSFSTFLENVLKGKVPNELKENSNFELLAFILKEEIRKIIIDAIKSKHPDKKLFVLAQPLEVEDISPFCKREEENLTTFLEDYVKDINMIREFKKKNNEKSYNNKNVKVKRGDKGEILILVKKYALIEDEKESEYIKEKKKNAEQHVMNVLMMMKDKFVDVRNERSKNKSRQRPTNSLKDIKSIMKIEDWIGIFAIDNYYEYFLIKDFLSDINFDTIKLSDLVLKMTQLNKVNKRMISSKFNTWLEMKQSEKDLIKDEFNHFKHCFKPK